MTPGMELLLEQADLTGAGLLGRELVTAQSVVAFLEILNHDFKPRRHRRFNLVRSGGFQLGRVNGHRYLLENGAKVVQVSSRCITPDLLTLFTLLDWREPSLLDLVMAGMS